MKHFISLKDLSHDEIRSILDDAHRMKKARIGFPKGKPDMDAPLAGYILGMIFEQPSTRTRFSFDVAMRQLGGTTIVVSSGEMQLGRGETVEDTGQVLSRMIDVLMIRTSDEGNLRDLQFRVNDDGESVPVATIPVICGMSNVGHPCQVVADLMTMEEHGVDLNSARVAWVGDGNNVCLSFVDAAAKFGFSLAIGCPRDEYSIHHKYGENIDYIGEARQTKESIGLGGTIDVFHSAGDAVKDADIVVTDTHVSMGDSHANERLLALAPFQVTESLMQLAKPSAKFMHCLPAHRGEEVTEEVIDGPRSIVFDEAENRIHAQKAILRWCLEV